MANMLYYCTAVDLIMQTCVRKKIAKFIANPPRNNHMMYLLHSNEYRPEPAYKEYIYAAFVTNDTIETLIILYEDRYCITEIFLQFQVNFQNPYELKFLDFGSNVTSGKIETIYDRPANFFIKRLLKRSMADGEILNVVEQNQCPTREQYIDLFQKVTSDYWTKKYIITHIDINNIIYQYADIYEIQS